jgi:hypothetical protein
MSLHIMIFIFFLAYAKDYYVSSTTSPHSDTDTLDLQRYAGPAPLPREPDHPRKSILCLA